MSLVSFTVRAKSRLRDTITQTWYYHADVILSRLCDTMYHTDVILNFRQVLDTEKNVCEMCSLQNFANSYISSTMFNFENCFFLKKSKYHVCVILSRLCDTLNVMDVQVSRRRDSITQTWYFNFLRKKQFSKLHIVEEMYELAKF